MCGTSSCMKGCDSFDSEVNHWSFLQLWLQCYIGAPRSCGCRLCDFLPYSAPLRHNRWWLLWMDDDCYGSKAGDDEWWLLRQEHRTKTNSAVYLINEVLKKIIVVTPPPKKPYLYGSPNWDQLDPRKSPPWVKYGRIDSTPEFCEKEKKENLD